MEQDSQTATTMNEVIDEIGRNFLNQFQEQLDYVLFGASMFQSFDSTLQQILRDGWVENPVHDARHPLFSRLFNSLKQK